MNTIGVGIIGTGFAERVQLPALRHVDGVRLAAIASGRRDNAERAASRFQIPVVCDSFEELVQLNEVDLVLISSPPHTHAPAATAAAAAGKHILCEKPMALDAAESARMTESAARAGVLNLIDHELRFNPNRKRAADLVANGYVGEVRHVTVNYRASFGLGRAFNWWYQTATGGGVLGAIGSHVVDTIHWWLGECESVTGSLQTMIPERPDSVSGESRTSEADDYAAFWMQMKSGAMVEVSLSSITTGRPEHSFEIIGSAGALFVDDERARLTGWRDGREEDLTLPDPARSLDGVLANIWAPAFVHFAREVVAALRDGNTVVPGAATFADGHRTQLVLDAIRQSSLTGASVRL